MHLFLTQRHFKELCVTLSHSRIRICSSLNTGQDYGENRTFSPSRTLFQFNLYVAIEVLLSKTTSVVRVVLRMVTMTIKLSCSHLAGDSRLHYWDNFLYNLSLLRLLCTFSCSIVDTTSTMSHITTPYYIIEHPILQNIKI